MKQTLLFMLCLFGIQLQAQLSGTYTIGGTNPDYQDIAAAVTDLDAGGIVGDVTFTVRAGIYGPISLNGISGSDTYSITVEGETGNFDDVKIFAGTANAVKLENIGDFAIRYMTLSSSAGKAIRAERLDRLSIEYCTSFSIYLVDIEEQLTLRHSTFAGNVQLGGKQTASAIIEGNTINSYNADILDFTKIQLLGNEMTVSNDFEVSNDTSIIAGNNFPCFLTVLNSNSVYLANNFAHHIQLTGVPDASIFHNSFSHGMTLSTTGAVLKNNIIHNVTSGNALHLSYPSDLVDSDYNSFTNAGGPLFMSDGSNIDNIADWQNTTGFDQNSTEIEPTYASGTDFHIRDFSFQMGTPISGLTEDIDGEARNGTTPFIGADEFYPLGPDVVALGFVLPAKPVQEGNIDITFTYFNNCNDTITEVVANWSLNGIAQPPFTSTQTLFPRDTHTVMLGSYNFEAGRVYDIGLDLILPNNQDIYVEDNDFLLADYAIALEGTYTIGGNSPYFLNITKAVEGLQLGGILNEVTFEIRPDVYDGFSLRNVLGNDANNGITFLGMGSAPNNVKIASSNSNSVQLDNVENITFRNLSVENDNSYEGFVANFIGKMEIDNCNFKDNSTFAVNINQVLSQLTFKNSKVTDGEFKVEGQSSSTALIENNTIDLFDLSSVTNARVIGNAFKKPSINFCNSLEFARNTVNGGQSSLKIKNSDSALVHNNFISTSGTTQLFNNADFQLIHNSFNSTAQTIILKNNTALVMKNNSIANGTSNHVLYFHSGTFAESDHNNFRNKGNSLFLLDQTYLSNLNDWRNATGLDQNSISIDPQYASLNDLHAGNQLLQQGTPIAAVPQDFDGENRDPVLPWIGADEYPTLDGALISIETPQAPFAPGVHDIKVTLQNASEDDITSAEIHWDVNGVAQPPVAWTGTLVAQATTEVPLGSYDFQESGEYYVTATLQNINGGADGTTVNNEVSAGPIATMLGGAYTIGGNNPDFVDFTEAIAAMELRGLYDAVVFNVREGFYEDGFSLGPVPNNDANNTITFQGLPQDSTLARLLIDYNTQGFVLNNVTHVTFRYLNFIPLHYYYYYSYTPNALYLGNGTNNITVESCYLRGSYLGGKIIAASQARHDNITIRNNFIQGNDILIHLPGTVNSLSSGLLIENNEISFRHYGYDYGNYTSAIYLSNQDAPVIKDNRVAEEIVEFYSCNNGLQFTGNRLIDTEFKIVNSTSNQGNEGLVANNYIESKMSIQSSSFLNIYHNTINTPSNNPAYRDSNTDDIRIVNNIFASDGLAISLWLTPEELDHNDYYSTASSIIQVNGTAYGSLADWQAVTTMDVNSISVDPQFTTSGQPYVSQTSLGAAAKPIPGITTDIDGEIRKPIPDIGAVEFFIVSDTDNQGDGWDFRLFPNPSVGFLNLRYEGPAARMEVSNALGQVLLGKNVVGDDGLDLSGFAKGIYFVKLTANGESIIKKIALK